jgi:alpha-mannosidase
VRRGLAAEGGPHERGLPTFVSRRFVDCTADDRGVSLLHDGLLEYEVVGDGTELALTLLRATGYLSRSEPEYRPNPAGPLDRLDGPQLQRPLALDYAVLLHRGDWRAAGVDDAADDVLVPLEHVGVDPYRTDAGARHPTGSALSVDGARVSALARDESGATTLRVVNLSDGPARVTAAAHGEPWCGSVVDLAGERVAAFHGSLPLGPWEIVTIRSEPPG